MRVLCAASSIIDRMKGARLLSADFDITHCIVYWGYAVKANACRYCAGLVCSSTHL